MTGVKYKGYVLRWIYPAVGEPFVAIHDAGFDNEYVCSSASIASAKRLVNAFIITDELARVTS